MEREEALRFLKENHRGVLGVLGREGRPHLSPVLFALIDGKIQISSTWDRVKTRYLQRDPRASLCVLTEKFYAPYLTVEGRVELLPDPDGRKNLALYQAITGGPPKDLAEYLAAMKREKRLVYEMTIERMYPLGN